MKPTWPLERSIFNRRPRGMTLIELMITVTVIAICLAIGVPSFGRLLATNRMATQTNEFVAALHLTRSEAVRRSQPMTIRSAKETEVFQGGWDIFPDMNADGKKPSTPTSVDGEVVRTQTAWTGNTTLVRVTQLAGPPVTYPTATDASRMSLTFNARGASNDGNAFFKVCDGKDTSVKGRIVRVSSIGAIALESTTTTCP